MLQFHGNDTKNTKVLLLLLVGILLIVVAVIAGKVLVDSRSAEPENMNVSKKVMDSVKDAKKEEELSRAIGIVSGITTREGSEDLWIALSVPDEKSENKIIEYKFFIGKGTKGSEGLKGGDFVTIHFQGNPSEKDYMTVKEVEIARVGK